MSFSIIHIMHERVQAFIKREGLFDPGQPILIGVSGGPDSLALLDILDRLGYQLIIAHLNHGLRSEAEADANEVCRIAEARGFHFALEEKNVGEFAESHNLSVEEAARTVRYQFLFQQAVEFRAQAVAVGHTADDQVETVVMHLLRGSGLAGLRGMQFRALPNSWSQRTPLVRPLLAFWRNEILAYCEQHNLQPLFDRTNLEVTYFRNRLRHELIPYLETYNPAVKEIFWRMSLVLSGDYQVLEDFVDEAWKNCIQSQAEEYVILDPLSLRNLQLGVQRRLIRKAINILRPGLRDVDFDSIERAIAFLVKPTQTRQIDLVAGLRLFIENGKLILADWEAELPYTGWPQLIVDEPRTLEVPGKLDLGSDWFINAELVSDLDAARKQALDNKDPYKAWISSDYMPVYLQLRTRKAGDRFKPIGMEGHSVKLSEYMINHKIPQRARKRWPLVVFEQDIIWVPGIALSHQYRLTSSTRKAFFCQLQQKTV